MKKPILHRYGYVPNYNMKTEEYSWRKLKVVKVWWSANMNGIQIKYVLENCSRFDQHSLYTEDDIKNMCPKRAHSQIVNAIMSMSRYPSQTIYSPATEQGVKRRGDQHFKELLEDSKKVIQDCIENDIIIGEESIQEIINNY